MQSLEHVVAEIESVVEPAPEALLRVMTTYEDDVAEPVKQAIRTELVKLRDEITETKKHYDLYSDTISNRRRLIAKLSVLAIDLTECRSEYLRGYGAVPGEEREPLDERMSRLEAIVNQVRGLLSACQHPKRP